MFAVGPRGHWARYHQFVVVIVVVVFNLRSSGFVVGWPEQHTGDKDRPRAGGQGPDTASPPAQSVLRFSPELRLEPPAQDGSSNNVGPLPPVFPYRPSAPSQPPSSPHNNNNLSNNHLNNHNDYNNHNNHSPAFSHHNKVAGDDDDDDLDAAPPFSGDGPRKDVFEGDLDDSEETWEQDPDVLDSHLLPPTASQKRTMSDRTPTLTNQGDKVGDKDKVVVVPPLVENDFSVDRLGGNWLGGYRQEDASQDLDLPQLGLKARDPETDPTAAGSGNVVLDPGRMSAGSQDGIVPSPARDVDVDGVPVPSPLVDMSGNVVPAEGSQVLPWQEMLQRDVHVDSTEQLREPVVDDTELREWKKMALEDLDSMDGDRKRDSVYDDELVTDIDVDLENSRNPFEDEEDGEDGEESEVPEELVQRVVHAMMVPAWRLESPSSSGAGTASVQRGWEAPHKDGDVEVEEVWIAMTEDDDDDDDYYDDSEDDEYVDWVLAQEASRNSERGNSRLITLIFETIGVPDQTFGEDGDEEDAEEETKSADAFEKELGIWQVLTNFPFPMLLAHSDQFGGSVAVDYIYDDDDDEDYDDEDYYDDYYDDDDDYDDEDYEDYEEDENDSEEDSDELDDYFYSKSRPDCDDCDEKDGVTTKGKKQEMTVLSLPSMLIR